MGKKGECCRKTELHDSSISVLVIEPVEDIIKSKLAIWIGENPMRWKSQTKT